MFAFSLFFYFLIKRYLWTIEINAVLTYLFTASLITYANFRTTEEWITTDVKAIISCNAVIYAMHMYVLMFNSNYVISQYVMMPVSLLFWIINSSKISEFLIPPHTAMTVMMVFFFMAVNYEQFLHKAELFVA